MQADFDCESSSYGEVNETEEAAPFGKNPGPRRMQSNFSRPQDLRTEQCEAALQWECRDISRCTRCPQQPSKRGAVRQSSGACEQHDDNGETVDSQRWGKSSASHRNRRCDGEDGGAAVEGCNRIGEGNRLLLEFVGNGGGGAGGQTGATEEPVPSVQGLTQN